MRLVVENYDVAGEVDRVEQASWDKLLKPDTSLLLNKLSNYLSERNIQSYVVGGFIRDLLLRRETADIDIAVAADALEIAPQIAAALGGKYVLLDEINRIGRVVISEKGACSAGDRCELDFSTLKGSIEQDLAQRDFTIDALAIELDRLVQSYADIQTGDTGHRLSEIIVDPFGGRRDLEQGVIRAVSRGVFASDAVRLLRAVRLAYELGFSITGETESLIKQHSRLITGVSGERVREELLRLLAISPGERLLLHLDELDLLTNMIPELAQEKGVGQPKEHFWDVFDHSLKIVDAIDFVLRRGSWEYGGEEILTAVPWSTRLREHFDLGVSSGSTRGVLLKLAALLHDLAKPQMKTIEDTGRIRFLGHAKEGAEIAVGILQKLRFSTREIKLVETLVQHHLRPTQMSQGGLPSHRAIYRFFRETGDVGIDILFLSLADHLATRGPHLNLAHWQEHTQMVDYVLVKYLEQETRVGELRLISGDDVISLFGIQPGPRIGKLLEAVREAQASGELGTRAEALTYIREHLSGKEE